MFKIDVGGIAPQDVEQYMQKVMTQMKRHQVVDPTTGRVDLRYNPLSIEEDYFIPIRGGAVLLQTLLIYLVVSLQHRLKMLNIFETNCFLP